MKIYLLIETDNNSYAGFGHLGTWSKTTEKCEICQYDNQILIEPLKIEWWPGSDRIGDLSWCSYTFIVSEEVKTFLMQNKFESEFGKVVVEKPTEKKRGQKRVAWPYNGPLLHWTKPLKRINLDINKSGLTIYSKCVVCGRIRYNFQMNNIIINQKDWNGEKMFRIIEFGKSAATFITHDALNLFLSQNFTNFHYQEAGIIE